MSTVDYIITDAISASLVHSCSTLDHDPLREKAYDSLEHAVLLDCLFDAGIKGRAWRIISCMYNSLCAVVKSGFPISALSLYFVV